jgi:hypothetical protein
MVALVVGLLTIPNVSAYYWTANPPANGYHGNPPGGTTCDGSGQARIWDIVGLAEASLSTGGPNPGQPENVIMWPGRLVFYVDYILSATCDDPNLDHVTARVDLVLSRWVNNQWIAQDTDFIVMIAYLNDDLYESGHLYVYDSERQYQQNDLYCLSYEATCWYVEDDMSIHMADNKVDFSYYKLIA